MVFTTSLMEVLGIPQDQISLIFRLLGVLCESGFTRILWDLNLMSVMDTRYFVTSVEDDLEVSYFATRRPSKKKKNTKNINNLTFLFLF